MCELWFQGLSYPIHCRRAGPEAPEQIVLDVNKLAEGLSHCDVGSFSPSPDHKWLAYSLDDTGNETYKVQFERLPVWSDCFARRCI